MASKENISNLVAFLSYLEAKDQFKWFGNFQQLISLVKMLLEVDEDGDTSEDPAHKMFSFKVGGVIVKWFSSTHTVQTQGADYAILREKLGKLIASKNDLLRLDSGQNVSCSDDCNPPNSPPSPASVDLISPQTSESSLTSNAAMCGGCLAIKSDIQILHQKVNDLQNFVNSRNMQMHPDNNHLQSENSILQEQVKSLQNLLDTERSSLAKANATIKNLENERASLITALKLLNEDQAKSTMHDSLTPRGSDLTSSSPLDCTHDDNSWSTVQRKASRSSSNRNNHNIQPTNPETTVILGDSMIKHIDTRRMRSCGSIHRKFFPGCSSNDMKHYMIPSLSKNPDQVVIHVGTNDLQHSADPRVLASNITELASEAEGPSKRKVFISSIIRRRESTLNNKVDHVNKLLQSSCLQRSWKFIDNSNILSNHLNNDGIHLNRKGTALLVNNISSLIRLSSN